MYVLSNSVVDLEPGAGEYTKTVTLTLDASKFYKFIFGAGETDVFAPVDGDIPVYLNVHAQGGNAVTCTVSGTTLVVTANYPGLGAGLLIEYANVVEDSTDVRSYVTNWPDPQNVYVTNWPDPQTVSVTNWPSSYTVGNWPDTYTVTGQVDVGNWPSTITISGEVSLTSQTISDLAEAIAAAISGNGD